MTGKHLLGLLAVAAFAAKSYTVDGIVVAVDPTARTLLVSHRPIGKYMGAMMMPFRVENAAELTGLYPGVRIQFELVVGKDHSVARNVRRTGGADAEIPPPKEKLKIGDPVADFRLTDQQGGEVRLDQLRGKVLAINFLYTRCPLPDVCPRLAANFATLQRRFQPELGKDLMLASVTVDPDYDTPAVLADYAKRWGADSRGWRFLTGDVGQLAAELGEVYWTDEGSIGHNSMTSVISREGRLVAVVEGSGYRVDQLAHLIARELEEGK
ncbi:Electron transport protein SCO1/SenC [Candidatus Sulfopaludibacter sp. SbA6]|nr:Electron transport protein SCO1/SenC [Candidatus Sulfopaludibacter sp. SbA6]